MENNEIEKFWKIFFPKKEWKGADNVFSSIITTDFDATVAEEYLKNNDLAILFPHFQDYLQRRDMLSSMVSIFYEKFEDPDFELGVRDLVISMTHNQTPYFHSRVFWQLILAHYPIPLLYPIWDSGKVTPFFSKNALSFLLHNIVLPVVLFVKPNSRQIKCTQLAAELFNLDTKRMYGGGSLSHPTMDIYFSMSKSRLDYRGVVVDVNGWSKEQYFIDAISQLSSISSIILVNIQDKDIATEDLKVLIELVKSSLNASIGKLLVVVRGPLGKISEPLEHFKAKYSSVECVGLEDCDNKENYRYKKTREKFINDFWNSIYKPQLEKNKLLETEIFEIFAKLAELNGLSTLKGILEKEHKLMEVFDVNSEEPLISTLYPLSTAKGKEREISDQLIQETSRYSQSRFKDNDLTKLVNDKFNLELNFHKQMITEFATKMGDFFASNNYDAIMQFENKLIIKEAEKMNHLIIKSNEIRNQINITKGKLSEYARKNEELERNNSIARQDAINENRQEEEMLLAVLNKLNEELNKIKNLMEGLNIGLDSLVEEITISQESQMSRGPKMNLTIEKFIKAFAPKIFQGMEIKLLKGSPLYISCGGFDKIMEDISKELQENHHCKRLSVVSIIGNQSSCKSTLINYLTGSNFPTSEGRCTKGVGCYLTNFGDGHFVLFLDTEGLQSLEGRENLIFDKQLTIFSMIISQVVILNLKGDLSAKECNLLQVCLFAFNHLRSNKLVKPTMIFTLRDQNNPDKVSKEVQKGHFAGIKKELIDSLSKFHISLDGIIDMNPDDIFLMQIAINAESVSPEKIGDKWYQILNGTRLADEFPTRVKELRVRIREILDNIDDSKRFQTLQAFYAESTKIFESIIKYGVDICNFEVISKLQMRDNVRKISIGLLNDESMRRGWDRKVKDAENEIEKSQTEGEIDVAQTKFNGETAHIITEDISKTHKNLLGTLALKKIVYDMAIEDDEKKYISEFFHRMRKLREEEIKDAAVKRKEQINFEKHEKELNLIVAGINKDNMEELKAAEKKLEEAKAIFLIEQEQKFFSEKKINLADRLSIEFNCHLAGYATNQEDYKIISPINCGDLCIPNNEEKKMKIRIIRIGY